MAPLRISTGLSAHHSLSAYQLTGLQTTSGADGRLIVWDVSEGEGKEVKLELHIGLYSENGVFNGMRVSHC